MITESIEAIVLAPEFDLKTFIRDQLPHPNWVLTSELNHEATPRGKYKCVLIAADLLDLLLIDHPEFNNRVKGNRDIRLTSKGLVGYLDETTAIFSDLAIPKADRFAMANTFFWFNPLYNSKGISK